MTQEQIIEELKRLKSHNNPKPQEEIDSEVMELDASIEEYNEQIAELEAKIANMDNYQYVNPNEEERELTEELLEEAFAKRLTVIEQESQEYIELQDMGKEIIADYDQEIASLNEEIAAIERRIRKNDIAVRKNIGIRLSDEELADLTEELETKKARLAKCEKMKGEYTEELIGVEELIANNNKQRKILIAKQNRLNSIKENRTNNVWTVDKFRLRLDKDELARLKAGVKALESRKEFITYDANAEIDRLIAAVQQGKEDKTVAPTVENQMEENNEAIVTPIVGAPLDKPVVENDTTIISPTAYYGSYDNVKDEETDEIIPDNDVYSDYQENPDYQLALISDSPLDLERVAVVEETPAELKEKRKLEKVKEFLKKYKKAFIAAGLALVIALGARGCSNLKNAGNDIDNSMPPSYTQDSGDIEDSNDFVLDNEDNISSDSSSDVEDTDDKENENNQNQSGEDQNENDNQNDLTNDSDQNLEPTPDPTPEPTPDPIPEPTPQPPVDDVVETVELKPGEQVANIGDIVQGDRIEHGDEVGTELGSGVKVQDYNEEGNAIVELPSQNSSENSDSADSNTDTQDTEDQTLQQALEDFFGGPISITDGENSYEQGEEISSSKTR